MIKIKTLIEVMNSPLYECGHYKGIGADLEGAGTSSTFIDVSYGEVSYAQG